MNYIVRTTPHTHCSTALAHFDTAVQSALCSSTGLPLGDVELTQASFAVKQGGLGLRSSMDIAAAAYLGSRSATHECCAELRCGHRWDSSFPGYLQSAGDQCNSLLAEAEMASRIRISDPELKQSQVSALTEEARVRTWKKNASPDMICNLHAFSALLSGKVLGVVPSKTLDKNLSQSEFVNEVAARLHVDVFEANTSCTFCGTQIDTKGRHCYSCMAGGDTVVEHNTVRDIVYDYCRRGCLRPDSEAPELLRNISAPDGRRRPADVLVCSSSCIARTLPDGAHVAGRKVALDFAVINSLGRTHWSATMQKSGSAEEAYAIRKCRHQQTEAKCRQANLEFQPIVMSSQGSMTPAMGAVLHGIADAVATIEGCDAAVIRKDIFERLAIAIARANARAITRRRIGQTGTRYVTAATALLEEAPGS